ncbi:hypothetical protein ACEPAG_2341 [Sanghuangporus baumii]
MTTGYASERHSSPSHGDTEHGVNIESRIDTSTVARITESAVTLSAKIAKDAKFVSFVASEAAEKCGLEKRKTVGGEDVLYALASLSFDIYSETLKIYLAKLRQHQTTNAAHCAGDGGHVDMDED